MNWLAGSFQLFESQNAIHLLGLDLFQGEIWLCSSVNIDPLDPNFFERQTSAEYAKSTGLAKTNFRESELIKKSVVPVDRHSSLIAPQWRQPHYRKFGYDLWWIQTKKTDRL